jgi:hypothetical protein
MVEKKGNRCFHSCTMSCSLSYHVLTNYFLLPQCHTQQRQTGLFDVEESAQSSLSESDHNESTSNIAGAAGTHTLVNNGKESTRPEKDITYYKNEIKKEKAGKRKLFNSLVKLAEELKRLRRQTADLQEDAQYRNQAWYEGGLWRAPQVLPEVHREVSENQRARPREAISLSDMFLNLVIVTGFTRVGLAITSTGQVKSESLLYFAVFWTIWGKETSYTTRFDATDLSAQLETLLACFAVLFASLSVSLPMNSEGGARIMMMAGFCSFMHVCLMGRVLWYYKDAQVGTVEHHVKHYALFNTVMNTAETATWISGVLLMPADWRWIVFLVAVFMALRIPRAFLANDFHGPFQNERSLLYSTPFLTSSPLLVGSCKFPARSLVHSAVGIHATECSGSCYRFF